MMSDLLSGTYRIYQLQKLENLKDCSRVFIALDTNAAKHDYKTVWLVMNF